MSKLIWWAILPNLVRFVVFAFFCVSVTVQVFAYLCISKWHCLVAADCGVLQAGWFTNSICSICGKFRFYSNIKPLWCHSFNQILPFSEINSAFCIFFLRTSTIFFRISRIFFSDLQNIVRPNFDSWVANVILVVGKLGGISD